MPLYCTNHQNRRRKERGRRREETNDGLITERVRSEVVINLDGFPPSPPPPTSSSSLFFCFVRACCVCVTLLLMAVRAIVVSSVQYTERERNKSGSNRRLRARLFHSHDKRR